MMFGHSSWDCHRYNSSRSFYRNTEHVNEYHGFFLKRPCQWVLLVLITAGWSKGRRIRCNVYRWKKIELLPSQTSIKSGCKWFVLHPESHPRNLNLHVLDLLKFHTSLECHNLNQTMAQATLAQTSALVVGPAAAATATGLGSPIPSLLTAGVLCSI